MFKPANNHRKIT